MRSSIQASRHYVVLDIGEEIMASVTTYAELHHITAASIAGIGAVTNVTLRYFEVAKKRYVDKKFEEEYELLSLVGNVSLLHDKPHVHIHVSLGDKNFDMLGGHLCAATISVTCELVIDTSPIRLDRTMDEKTGLHVWSCNSSQ